MQIFPWAYFFGCHSCAVVCASEKTLLTVLGKGMLLTIFNPFFAIDSELFDFHLFRFSIWRNHGRGQKKENQKVKEQSSFLMQFPGLRD